MNGETPPAPATGRSRRIRLPRRPWPEEVTTLRRARVIGQDWTVYQPGRAVWCPTQRPRLATIRHGAALEILAQAPSMRLRGPAVLLGGAANYYHSLADFALNLAALEDLPGGGSLPLIVDDAAPQHVARIVSALGIAPGRLVRLPAGRVALCDELVLLPRALGAVGQVRDLRAVAWFQAAVARIPPAGDSAPLPRRILISRARAAMRRVRNQERIAAICTRWGFTEVVLEDMPLTEQWRLFAGAEAVVAPHGAGLAHLLLMQPGTLVVEFVPGRGYCPPMFTNIAAGLGLRHVVLRQDANQNQPLFRVDPLGLRSALRECLGRP